MPLNSNLSEITKDVGANMEMRSQLADFLVSFFSFTSPRTRVA